MPDIHDAPTPGPALDQVEPLEPRIPPGPGLADLAAEIVSRVRAETIRECQGCLRGAAQAVEQLSPAMGISPEVPRGYRNSADLLEALK